MSQLQCGLAGEAPASPLILVLGNVLRRLKAHEEQRELHGGEVQLLEEPHAKDTSVEVQGHFGVLDAVHGLLEEEVLGGGVRLGTASIGLLIGQSCWFSHGAHLFLHGASLSPNHYPITCLPLSPSHYTAWCLPVTKPVLCLLSSDTRVLSHLYIEI